MKIEANGYDLKKFAMGANDVDINDAFDSIALSEERLSNEGFRDGFQKGSNEGLLEGYHLGYHRGAEIGAELGYYKGVMMAVLGKQTELTDKVRAAASKVLELIDKFPVTNVGEVDIIKQRDDIRARYKKACALLKIDSSYPEADTLSF